MSLSKKIVVLLSVVSIAVVIGWIAFRPYALPAPNNSTTASSSKTVATHGACLGDDEYADYPLDPKYAASTLLPKLPLVISVRDRTSGQEKSRFQIDDVFFTGHPLELHKCSVYVIKQFNLDQKKLQFLPGFRTELWQYHYDGANVKILTFSERKNATDIPVYYSYDFRIDSLEHYINLEKSFLGKDDYALVIKNIPNSNNTFILKLNDLLRQNPGIKPGSFDLGVWTDDGKYLWGNLYDGPFETAWYRIDSGTWKVDAFPPPPGIQSGVERTWNFRGWIAYADITSFTGDANITKQIEQDATDKGEQKHLWLYNFFTKQKTLVASANPVWRFDIQWVSDTVLQYHDPVNGTTTYTTPQ